MTAKIKKYLFVTLAVVFGSRSGYTAEEANRPNFLLILSDDQSVPDLECYGNPDLKTPNIDWLAKEGMRFNRMYTTAPQCAPSRKSILTGRSPIDMGVTRFTAALPKEAVTIMDILGDRGYRTALLGRIHHLDGFCTSKPSKEVYEKYKLNTAVERVDMVKWAPDSGNADLLAEFLDREQKDKPFFVQLSFSNPHRPWTAKEFEPDPSSLTLPPDFPDTELVRRDLAAYYGEVQQLDVYIGEVWQVLKERNLMDSTAILFIGDNGAALLRGKNTLFERGINVPFIVRWPNVIQEGGAVSDALLSGEDIVPTLLDALTLDIPDAVTGVSFFPVLKDPALSVRSYVFSERGAHGNALPGSSHSFDLIRCVIGERFKFIYNGYGSLGNYYPMTDTHYKNDLGTAVLDELLQLHKQGKMERKYSQFFDTPRPTFQVYDLQSDPYEFRNLCWSPENKDVTEKLGGELTKWMILQRDFLPLPIRGM